MHTPRVDHVLPQKWIPAIDLHSNIPDQRTGSRVRSSHSYPRLLVPEDSVPAYDPSPSPGDENAVFKAVMYAVVLLDQWLPVGLDPDPCLHVETDLQLVSLRHRRRLSQAARRFLPAALVPSLLSGIRSSCWLGSRSSWWGGSNDEWRRRMRRGGGGYLTLRSAQILCWRAEQGCSHLFFTNSPVEYEEQLTPSVSPSKIALPLTNCHHQNFEQEDKNSKVEQARHVFNIIHNQAQKEDFKIDEV
eukprot:751046-Hanusia_phi.AAC.2